MILFRQRTANQSTADIWLPLSRVEDGSAVATRAQVRDRWDSSQCLSASSPRAGRIEYLTIPVGHLHSPYECAYTNADLS